jgi:hypothetical protein
MIRAQKKHGEEICGAVMRVLVLGTSNSLLRGGWIDGLQETVGGLQVENRSVGASPGIQFATHIRTEFSNYDYVFIDSVPNDELYARVKWNGRVGYFTPEYHDSVMFDIASTARAHTNVVFLGIPRRDMLEPPSRTFLERREMARRLGSPFIDFRSAVMEHAKNAGITVDQSYDTHPAHPLLSISYGVGRSIGDMMNAGKLINRSAAAADQSKRYTIYSHQDWPNLPSEYRENSVMRDTFLRLRNGESIGFKDGRCVGYYINVRNTCCTATLEDSRGEAVFRTKLFYERSAGGILKTFIPTPDGLSGCRLVCGSERDTDDIGPHPQINPDGETDFVLSVSQICIMND